VRKLHLGRWLFALAVAAALGSQSHSQGRLARRTVVIGGYEAVAGEVLVKFVRDPQTAERLDLEKQLDADENEVVGDGRRMRSRSLDVAALRSFLRVHPGVVYAEPNYIRRAIVAPNDPRFSSLWGLSNVRSSTVEPGPPPPTSTRPPPGRLRPGRGRTSSP
jgi:hypothetical protein